MPFFFDRSPLNASCSFSSFRFRFLSTSWHIAKNKKKRHISSNLTRVVFHDMGVQSEAKIHLRPFFLNFFNCVSYLNDSQEKLSLSPKYSRRNIALFGLIDVRSSKLKYFFCVIVEGNARWWGKWALWCMQINSYYFPYLFWINISIWATAHLPLP